MLFVAGGVVAFAPVASSPAAAAPADLSVTVSASDDLVDGQAVDVRVAAPTGTQFSPLAGSVQICRDGPTYATEADLQFAAGNCPEVSVTSSASVANHAGLYVLPDLSSAVGTYRIGVGRVTWSRGAVEHELTCDSETPCRLVVAMRLGDGSSVVDSSTLLTFSDSSPLASCGGASPDAIDTAGPDRFIDTWARWTRTQCQATGGKASTTAVLAGEGLGLDSLAAGDADLTYSAVGSAMPGRDSGIAAAPSISVPIGVNAAVFALVGGYPDPGATDWPIGLRRGFDDVRVTPAEMASLFGQGVHGFNATGSADAVLARNPQLAFVNGVGGPVQAPASSDAVSFFTTRWFDTRADASWLSSPILDPPSQPRGVIDELSAASPPFAAFSMNMYSSRATLKKVVADDANKALEYNLTWVLTDLATAEQLGLPVAQVQNSRGEFVAPTTESMSAAVAGMERRSDGTVLPGTGPDAEGAYPLTFVEHAVVAAEPDCTGAAHDVLTSWIDFIAGDGQAQLVGVRPLAGDLLEVSKEARARVAAACDAKPSTDDPTTTPTTPTAPDGVPDAGGYPEIGGFDVDVPGSDGGSPDLGVDVDDAGAEPSERRASAESVEVAKEATSAPLLGRPTTKATAGLAALAGLGCMGAGAGTLGSTRRRPGAATRKAAP
ncbi:MAG: hypothetical protein KF906_12140 [Actinobacteria bacterium]|nr:hypothetical protein [Actinomycetota bacterium]